MDHSSADGWDSEMLVVKLNFPRQVMTEKWLLVLLVVGCTALVFLVCFPIDFCLYRRRKRLARERKNLNAYRPQTPTRLAQAHAKVNLTKIAAEIKFEELNETQRKYRAERNVRNILSIMKRMSDAEQEETLEFKERLREETVESNANMQQVMTPKTDGTTEKINGPAFSVCPAKADDTVKSVPQVKKQLLSSVSENDKRENLHQGSPHYISTRKYSNVSTTWKGNVELLQHESKHLKCGFRDLYGKMKKQQDETKSKYFYNARRRNTFHLGAVNYASDSQLEVSDTNRSPDIILENSTECFPEVFDVDVTCAAPTRLGKFKEGKGDISNDKLFQTVVKADVNKVKKRDKILPRSQSEQSLPEDFKNSKVYFKAGRKRNVVSPTVKNTFIFPELRSNEENFIPKGRALSMSTLSEEHSFMPKVTRTKKKKSYLFKKQSFNSMPELLYQNGKI